MNLIASRINSFENLEFKVLEYFSIQYFIASKPSLCGILEYNASISNDVNMVSFGMVSGRLFEKYTGNKWIYRCYAVCENLFPHF